MHIKVGFAHNGREIVIESEQEQGEILKQVQEFLSSAPDSAAPLVVEAAKGAKVILVRSEVAYVEIGAPTKSSVGFVR